MTLVADLLASFERLVLRYRALLLQDLAQARCWFGDASAINGTNHSAICDGAISVLAMCSIFELWHFRRLMTSFFQIDYERCILP